MAMTAIALTAKTQVIIFRAIAVTDLAVRDIALTAIAFRVIDDTVW